MIESFGFAVTGIVSDEFQVPFLGGTAMFNLIFDQDGVSFGMAVYCYILKPERTDFGRKGESCLPDIWVPD
jgi:hypothetical protein